VIYRQNLRSRALIPLDFASIFDNIPVGLKTEISLRPMGLADSIHAAS
jgi:hypothetical protein